MILFNIFRRRSLIISQMVHIIVQIDLTLLYNNTKKVDSEPISWEASALEILREK